jgi:predicted nucleotide-binding protein
MERGKAITRLQAAIQSVPVDYSDRAYLTSWKMKTTALLVDISGDDADVTRDFREIQWSSNVISPRPERRAELAKQAFAHATVKARTLLEISLQRISDAVDSDLDSQPSKSNVKPTATAGGARPPVFIGSSVEGLKVAYAIQQNIEHEFEPTVWSQGIFELSGLTIDSLIKQLSNFEYAIFVFSPDDVVKIRHHESSVVRDNVIFEFGLFIGALGRDRVFFVTPRSSSDLHLPTDLLGVTPGKYDDQRRDGNLNAALGPFCSQISQQIAKRKAGA